MSLIEGSDLPIIDQIKSRLAEIKDKLKEEGVTAVIFGELSKNAKLLQDKLDELNKKRGLLTQSDVNDAYATLQEVKRNELEAESKKARNKMILYIAIGVAIVGGLVYYLKDKK